MTAPAIRTRFDDRYRDCEQIEVIGSDVTHHRGLGDVGTRVVLYDMSAIGGCPRCGETEMIGSFGLNPDSHDDVVFYCTDLRCPHFVGDEVEYDMDRIRSDDPQVWDNTAECPECERRHTVEIERGSVIHQEARNGSSCIVKALCDACGSQIES